MPIFKVRKNQNSYSFEKKDEHHILNVLRYKIGDHFFAYDDKIKIEFKIKNLKPFSFVVVSKEVVENETYPINFFLPIIKKDNFERAIKCLNEMNIKSVTPTYYEFSQKNIYLDWKRIKKILEESDKQCFRTQPLVINETLNFKDLKKETLKGLNFFANLNDMVQDKKSVFKKNSLQECVNLFVGPEAGFSDNEKNCLISFCDSVKLTNSVLRAETAVVYLTSIIIEEIKKICK